MVPRRAPVTSRGRELHLGAVQGGSGGVAVGMAWRWACRGGHTCPSLASFPVLSATLKTISCFYSKEFA